MRVIQGSVNIHIQTLIYGAVEDDVSLALMVFGTLRELLRLRPLTGGPSSWACSQPSRTVHRAEVILAIRLVVCRGVTLGLPPSMFSASNQKRRVESAHVDAASLAVYGVTGPM
eukprot:GHVT01103951.1.p1 GENE.GHVT01103951.1~~GHVT01103951.1.p1  ORF type:complete len:114 (+),score=9.39 GHVT01103951.1:588-929(+)